jgi:hypothetical protein
MLWSLSVSRMSWPQVSPPLSLVQLKLPLDVLLSFLPSSRNLPLHPLLHKVFLLWLLSVVQGVLFPALTGGHEMAKIVELRKQEEDCSDEVHAAFMKRHDLMWKRPIVDEEITRIDTWLLQQPKLPMDILVGILARTAYVEWIFYGDLSPEQKHIFLIHLRTCYREFQKLPERWQEALWPMVWGRWAAEFADEEIEEAEAANG